MKSEPNLLEVNLNTPRMEKVLGNLVINALRYTSQGGKFQLSAKQPFDTAQGLKGV